MYSWSTAKDTGSWLLYIPPVLTFTNSTFCPHSVFMCFLWLPEETAIISVERERDRKKWRCVQWGALHLILLRGKDSHQFTALKLLRHCPLLFLVKVVWKQVRLWESNKVTRWEADCYWSVQQRKGIEHLDRVLCADGCIMAKLRSRWEGWVLAKILKLILGRAAWKVWSEKSIVCRNIAFAPGSRNTTGRSEYWLLTSRPQCPVQLQLTFLKLSLVIPWWWGVRWLSKLFFTHH
jgi:hypothetical protein